VRSFLQRQGSSKILQDIESFAARYENDPTLQDVVQDIDIVEDKIATAMKSRNNLEGLIRKMFTANKEVKFTDNEISVTAKDGARIGLSSLSSGEKHLLRLFVEMLLIGESSMIIDEPELSMHVDWQHDLVGCLRSLNLEAQLILATHSPEIMSDVADSKIFMI
jgi:predicted ATPase